MVVFSFPSFVPSTDYTVTSYSIIKSNAHGNTYLTQNIVSTGSQAVNVADTTNFAIGSVLTIGQNTANAETVTLTGVSSTQITANFTKTHTSGDQVLGTMLSQNPFGPWNTFVSNTTQNLSVVDMNGTELDWYRVIPTITMTAAPNQIVTLSPSRPFHSTTPLYDTQISALLNLFRQSYMNDVGVIATDSTIPTESTGQGAAPFITNLAVSRFYLSFIPNTAPVKFRESESTVWLGASSDSAVALTPYLDYYPNGEGGYIDFKSNPPANDYLKVEYKTYQFTDDQLRNMLINAVAGLSTYGITDQTYQVNNSWNYTYLTRALPSVDVGKIVCAIAAKEYMGAQILTMAQSAEQWKIGTTAYTSDPSRSIQGAVQYKQALHQEIRLLANSYIENTRVYFSRGEFDSFFDNSGILYPPFSVYNVFNYMSWWM